MKIHITTNDGVLIAVIEDAERFALDNPVAAGALLSEIKAAIERGAAQETPPHQCRRCGSPLDAESWCTDATCPHSD